MVHRRGIYLIKASFEKVIFCPSLGQSSCLWDRKYLHKMLKGSFIIFKSFLMDNCQVTFTTHYL